MHLRMIFTSERNSGETITKQINAKNQNDGQQAIYMMEDEKERIAAAIKKGATNNNIFNFPKVEDLAYAAMAA